MRPYVQYRNVEEEDLDDMGHVNNVRYVSWIQEISAEHWQSRAPEAIREQVAWVVYNHNITYYAPALPGEKIRISTYIDRTEKAFSYRVVQMHREKDDTLLLKAITTWCMVDIHSHRPKRIGPEIRNLFIAS